MQKENVIAVINQKGGVGKTTLTYSVATALAKKENRKVLMLDMDPQSSLTTWIIGEDEPGWSTYQIFDPKFDIATTTAVSLLPNLDFLPSSLDLAVADMVIAGRTRREYILRSFLDKIKDSYDAVIIDCPPTLGGITTNVLAASDHILVPTTAETMSIKGIGILENVVNTYHENDVMRPDRISGIVLMMYQDFIRHQHNNASSLRIDYGDAVFENFVRKGTIASEAASTGLDIYDYTLKYKKDPRIANDMEQVTKELISKFNL